MVSTGMAQTGGTYDITHAVVAGGGATQSSAGTYSIAGTAGQAAAGALSFGGSYQIRGGFWTSESLAPTSATVSIRGRVLAANGHGITGTRLVLTNAATGEALVSLSSTFGFYSFDSLEVGQTFILTASSKGHSFMQDTLVFTLTDELTDLNFVAF